jgi:hypothetical protein
MIESIWGLSLFILNILVEQQYIMFILFFLKYLIMHNNVHELKI